MKRVSPEFSKARVNRAGDNARCGNATPDDIEVIENCRGSHSYVLNTFQALLRGKTRYEDIVVAQRLKRRSTLLDKLRREPEMKLSRMHDIAGCRLIFRDVASLNAFRDAFHRSRFKHRRRNGLDAYDYIKSPKKSGYRGIHDVYEYNARSREGRSYNGLLIEVQYRTGVQHAWATAVEIAGNFTECQPKFSEGSEALIEFFRASSEILSRYYENQISLYKCLPDRELVMRLRELEGETRMLRTLRGLRAVEQDIRNSNNVILMFTESEHVLEAISFRTAFQATNKYFELEKEMGGRKDIVLVSADTNENLRYAFKNYFSDPNDFVKLMDRAVKSMRRSRRGMEKRARITWGGPSMFVIPRESN